METPRSLDIRRPRPVHRRSRAVVDTSRLGRPRRPRLARPQRQSRNSSRVDRPVSGLGQRTPPSDSHNRSSDHPAPARMVLDLGLDQPVSRR